MSVSGLHMRSTDQPKDISVKEEIDIKGLWVNRHLQVAGFATGFNVKTKPWNHK